MVRTTARCEPVAFLENPMSDETIKNAERAYQRALASGQIRERPAAPGLKRYTAADFKGGKTAARAPAAGKTTTHLVNNDSGDIILEIHIPRT